MSIDTPLNDDPDFDVIVIGAGFAGLRAMRRFRDELGLATLGLEAGSGVGGTWFWNQYPGARCDIESIHYSLSFDEELQQDWTWSERYAAQPEILAYLEHVADRFDLRRSFQFDTRVESSVWDDATQTWTVTTTAGTAHRARFVVCGSGNLTIAKEPEFPGRESFAGTVLATHRWPRQEPGLTGKRVGVIGTGASGIQAIPKIAEECEQLTVFQRTPNFACPLGNRPMGAEEMRAVKADYPAIRKAARESFLGVPYPEPIRSALDVSEEERATVYQTWWDEGGFGMLLATFGDLLLDKAANDTAADFVRSKIRERVNDPKVAELLCPDDHAFGTKRLPMETNYYETYNLPHVELVSVKENPISEITPAGVRLADGREIELDVLVFATGFDAWTGALTHMGIIGRDGLPLEEYWAEGPKAYLGLMSHGFPNLFMITGPGSAVAFYNNPLAIEDHVDLASAAIEHVLDSEKRSIEPSEEAQAVWQAELHERCFATLLPTAKSWYMGANIPGKPRVAMMYVGAAAEFRATCTHVVENDFKGFLVKGAPVSADR